MHGFKNINLMLEMSANRVKVLFQAQSFVKSPLGRLFLKAESQWQRPSL